MDIGPDASPVERIAYTYGPSGSRTSKTTLAGAESYSYDPLYQLTAVAYPDGTSASYAYGNTGNRASDSSATYDYSAANRITRRGVETFTHDGNGNMILRASPSGTTVYKWDFENRLVRAELPDGTIAEYRYDALGRRVEKRVTTPSGTTVYKYLYDGYNMAAEYDAGGSLIRGYTMGLGLDEPLAVRMGGEEYYYHRDGLGSVIALTDAEGQVVQRYAYDAFGSITYTMNAGFYQPFRFVGKYHDDETGLLHFPYRYYDAELGRFISEDPIGFAGKDNNLYRYVGNRAIDRSDPLGLIFLEPIVQKCIKKALGWLAKKALPKSDNSVSEEGDDDGDGIIATGSRISMPRIFATY